jgi:hypothetical protein
MWLGLMPINWPKCIVPEAVGIAYDYVRFTDAAVTHLDFPEADGYRVPADTPLFGYSARAGVLDIGDGIPAALPVITAEGRQFSAFTQDRSSYLCAALMPA